VAAIREPAALIGNMRMQKMSVMSQSETSRTTKTTEHPDGSIYRFLECTAGQYMTHAVVAVTRQVTLRDLERLFEKHDFNSFPVAEEGTMLGIVTKFDFLKAFALTTVRWCRTTTS
jgi:CBS-domain-containing membrane protein